MAHVLLPCDLPNWTDIHRLLAALKLVKDAQQLIQGMIKLYDLCSTSLEPEELTQSKKEVNSYLIFEDLQKFIEELPEEERTRFFNETLQNLVSQALSLRLIKPQLGFLYSLKREAGSFELERNFVKSLLANAFFSTFPKRTPRTHPCLQNFSFCDFFQHLHRRSHQKKLKAFLRYFQRSEERKKSTLHFHRKVLSDKLQPSLPSWLCSDRALIPLIVRQDGNIHEAEENICRAFPCSSLIGGDVLQTATAPESSLFFAFPELMCCLSFVEELESNEAFLAQNVVPFGIHKSRQYISEEVSICLMDSIALAPAGDEQFEDRSLLRELNKALASFSFSGNKDEEIQEELKQRRQTPVGESSSSGQQSGASSRRASSQKEDDEQRMFASSLSKKYSLNKSTEESKTSSHSSISKQDVQSGNHNGKTTTLSNVSISGELCKITNSPKQSLIFQQSSGSRSSNKSLKTASDSSAEHLKVVKKINPTRTAEDEYYTADEDSDQCSEKKPKRQPSTSKEADLSSLVYSTSSLVGEKPPKQRKDETFGARQDTNNSNITWGSKDSSQAGSISQRSETRGFVLGGTGSEDDIGDLAVDEEEESGEPGPPMHERLDDFRKRIRRRTRRSLSRKMRSSSRSSYSFGSSTSSDMEDISEEEDIDESFQYYHPMIRSANSEPSLTSINNDTVNIPPFSLGADTVVLSLSGRNVVVTSSNGQLKAYSYDGVSPNLPVPFRAKFRTKKSRPRSEEYYYPEDPRLLYELGARKSTFSDSEEDRSQETSISRLSSLSSFAYTNQGSINKEEIVCRNKGDRPRCAVAVGPSRHGDPQLRALTLWLAASMAGLPSLVFYTGHEFQLYELSTVYRKVLARHWTIGDLSCELLRFCRNRLSPRRNSCSSSLFEQLLCSGTTVLPSTPLTYSQHSLD